MAAYDVKVLRAERICFEINAADPGDASRRYLMDGDEPAANRSSGSRRLSP